MVDPFDAVFSSVSDPGERVVTVVPSDTVDLTETPKALYVGTGGDIAMIGDNEVPGTTATGCGKTCPAERSCRSVHVV